MSLSKKISLLLLLIGVFILPKLAHAQTIIHGDEQWGLSVNSESVPSDILIRNNFTPLDLARASILGDKLTMTATLFDAPTVATIENIVTTIDQPTQNAQLVITNNTAQQFNPGQTGQTVDLSALIPLLNSNALDIDLPVVTSVPTVSLSDTNQLGINDLVATGESDFSGSSSNRIHNIVIGAQKYNGVILAPGQEFSFDQTLGEVDEAHGFVPELVIQGNSVIPEDGGGLCQVSTTAFRAAMNAGLPITDRRNHSFAVSYYSPQGTDATIYPGSADLKFINNLSSSLLIETQIIGKKLYFYYYGTKDDRTVSFDGPTVYDRKPDGSLKATWVRHVTINDQTTTQTFNSTYLSPALFEKTVPTQPGTPPAVPPDAAPLTQT